MGQLPQPSAATLLQRGRGMRLCPPPPPAQVPGCRDRATDAGPQHRTGPAQKGQRGKGKVTPKLETWQAQVCGRHCACGFHMNKNNQM